MPAGREHQRTPPRHCAARLRREHLDDRGQYGLTALHYAVRGGKLPLIKLLLERGAKSTRSTKTV